MATIDDAWAGAKILHELIQTPNMKSLHFKLDVSVDEVATVKYTIEQFAVEETFNEKGEK